MPQDLTYDLFYRKDDRRWFFIVRLEPTWWQQQNNVEGEAVAIGWRRYECDAIGAAERFIAERVSA